MRAISITSVTWGNDFYQFWGGGKGCVDVNKVEVLTFCRYFQGQKCPRFSNAAEFVWIMNLG